MFSVRTPDRLRGTKQLFWVQKLGIPFLLPDREGSSLLKLEALESLVSLNPNMELASWRTSVGRNQQDVSPFGPFFLH